jgi:hypothetical protein
MSNERMPQYGNAQNEYAPKATVASGAPNDYVQRATVVRNAQDEYNPRGTMVGCASCGYPMKPGDMECPVCGIPFAGNQQAPVVEKAASQAPPPPPPPPPPVKKGTMIQSAHVEKETPADTERRKLTGFLVTYSHTPNGEFFPHYEGKNSIGRSEECNVTIQNDTKVSEKHLSILYRTVDRKFKFKDEQSSNGTFINGELTDEGELKNLDKIGVGNTLLLFMEIPNLIEN